MLSPDSTAAEIVAHLRALGSEESRQGMKRYGIRIDRALGISHGEQKKIAKAIKRNHERAFELWATGIAEARFIAAQTADPKRFTAQNARDWAAEFDSWDIVDGVSDLFVDTDHWTELIDEFAADEREFVRRTAFAMMAWAVVHRKKEPDATFFAFLPVIERHARDERNFVKKAVSWALRSIGKRNHALNRAALDSAGRLAASDDRSARWIGRQAVRELTSEKTLAGVSRREAAAAKRR
ncbi:MAG: DNA alkylation repair protein [Rhizobiaceae bacterium]|nr:DNA alkylation repair protein [Rhizobiaceae bacterium]MCV0407065.1 DNA alkylation repair protein [Rhizobiaceae bacterium]